MNKKGDLVDWGYLGIFIFLLVIFFGGIVIGSKVFFGAGYDFREAEAEIMFEVIERCLLENEIGVYFELFDTCRLNKNSFDNYIILINSEGEEIAFEGVRSFVEECGFSESLSDNNKGLPKCINREIVKDEKTYEILIGSNQDSRKVLT